MISVVDLKKSYRVGFWLSRFEALKGVSFNVASKKITGFVGSNGAGKTTTIRCLLGFTKIDSGQITFFDNEPLSPEVRRRIGYMPEQPHFYDQLTGYEFLKLHASLSNVSVNRREVEQHLEKVLLAHAMDRKLREYSKGMLQRIGIIQSLIHSPELLILDEPMSGLDPDGRRLIKNLLRDVAASGVTLFFSTHLLDDVEDLCEDAVLMSKGHVQYNGNLKSLLRQGEETYQIVIEGEAPKKVRSQRELQEVLKTSLGLSKTVLEVRPVQRRLEDIYADLSRQEAR